tara:strand:+ start:51054 stop:53114 length:2061 start_codon:yes stop_codon:yes gene_type:complete
MSSIAVPCPHCKKKLKLRDKSLLGKKAKCPNCKQAFVLKLPAMTPDTGEHSVPVESSQKPPASAPQIQQNTPPATETPRQEQEEKIQIELAQPATPVVGTSAKWVPDEPATPPPAVSEPAPSGFPQIDTSAPPVVDTSPAPNIDTGAADSAFPNIAVEATENAGVARMRELRRKNAKRRNVTIASIAVVLLLIGIGGYFVWDQVEETIASKPVKLAPVTTTKPAVALSQPATPAPKVAASPTNGTPIRLLYVPAGTRILIHLRPAELWAPGSQGEEFRACLGPVGIWAEQIIKEICLTGPAQIQELTFCLILGSPGAPPEYAAVIRTAEPFKRSELIAQLDGQRLDDYSFPVYSGEKYSSMIVDDHTYAIGPPGNLRAAEMAEAREYQSSTSPGIESVLKQTDRDRHLTIVFDPDEVRRQQDVLLPEKAHPFINEFLDWIGEDVETVAWSMHLGSDDFYSEWTFRNSTMIRPGKLAINLKEQLDALPEEMLESVQKMNPGTVGSRKVIGRFPAMLKAFSMANQEQSGERYAQLVSNLPERAAPNLALASLLTWDESTRTDFSVKAKPRPTGPQLPDKVVDRLKMKLEVDFKRMPLEEVLAYIADETKTKIILDGAGLKLVGYTQNMRQTMNLGTVSALETLQAIFNTKDQEQMCLIIDETAKTATVTSKPFAQQNNLKMYEFPPAK